MKFYLSAWTDGVRRVAIPLLGFDPWCDHSKAPYPVPIEKDPWFKWGTTFYESVVPLNVPVGIWIAKQWIWSRLVGEDVWKQGPPLDVQITEVSDRNWVVCQGSRCFHFELEPGDATLALFQMCELAKCSDFKSKYTHREGA